MSEIKLNAEALEEAGAALGFAVAALIRGFQAGMDAYDVMLCLLYTSDAADD